MNKNILEQLYIVEKRTLRDIAGILGVSNSTVYKNIVKHNLKLRSNQKYTFNKEYFKIPNIDNCYWAGFIAADGCISKNSKNSFRLYIQLKDTDVSILDTFKNNIGHNGPIRDVVWNLNGKSYLGKVLSISSIQNNIMEDLNSNFSITENKTSTLQAPNLISIDHKLSFIRGYIDGDGTICSTITNQGYSRLNLTIISASRVILDWILETIYEACSIRGAIYNRGSNFLLSYSSTKNTIKILNSIDAVKGPYVLERKWNKFYNFPF